MERKVLALFAPRVSECSRERKFIGNESFIYGLFAQGNESAEERKVQMPDISE